MSQKKLFWLVILCLQFFSAYFSYADTIVSSTAQSRITLADYFYLQQIDKNLSAAAFASHSTIRCSVKNSFILKELTSAALGCSLKHQKNLFSLRVSHVGYSLFGEMDASSGYARLFGQRFAFAMQFHYFWQHASGYEGVHSLTFDLLLYAKLAQKLYLGFSAYNPARLKYGLLSEVPLPVRFTLDLNYELSRNIMLVATSQTELQGNWNIRVGAYYKMKCLFVQTQFQFPEVSCDIVAAIAWRRCLLGATFQYKLPLGIVSEIQFQMML